MRVLDLLRLCIDVKQAAGVLAANGRDGMTIVPCEDAVIVAIRGTLSEGNACWDDWRNTLRTELAPCSFAPGKVHAGFLDSLNALWMSLKEAVRAAQRKNVPLVLTGHSKGGAVAVLAAAKMDALYLCSAMTVVTFGAPRVGDEEFCRSLNLPGLVCYEASTDVVPHLPPFGYADTHGACGTLIRADDRDETLRSLLTEGRWQELINGHDLEVAYLPWLTEQGREKT